MRWRFPQIWEHFAACQGKATFEQQIITACIASMQLPQKLHNLADRDLKSESHFYQSFSSWLNDYHIIGFSSIKYTISYFGLSITIYGGLCIRVVFGR